MQIITSAEEWRTARLSLLEKEKQHTREADELAKLRADMPLLKVDPHASYTFTGLDDTQASLSDLFADKDQLIIYHLMFGPDWDGPCKSCSFFVDSLPKHLELLHTRNTQLVLVSRAPAEKLRAWSAKMGWDHIPWYSSEGSAFNYDFHATQDETVKDVEYNYRTKAELQEKGLQHHAKGEQPGMSVFIKCPQGQIFHSYSTYARGLDRLLTQYSLLELTPSGRQDPEDVKAPGGGKYHFEY